MQHFIKNILKAIGAYYPLLLSYHKKKRSLLRKRYKKQYEQYAGKGFTCNVCGAVYSKFVPAYPPGENKAAIESNHVIAGYGENIYCPNCLSTARDRLVIAFLHEEADIRNKKILHFSPERHIYQYLEKRAGITTADICPEIYKDVDKQIQKQDATSLGFENDSFDMVVANHILEHIHQDKIAMREIFRVLKPGGMAVLQVPYSETLLSTIEDLQINDPAKQAALYGQKDHVRIYALNDYVKRLKETGFVVDVLAVEQFLKFATQPDEKFFRIIKPL